MAYTTPKNNYIATDKILHTIHNEISDNTIYLKGETDTHDNQLTTLESKVGQSLNTNNTPSFEDINLTGLSGSVETNIEGNAGNISTNTSNISTNTSNISTNTSNISTNTGDISDLESKVGQSLNTTDNVAFVSVNTDNVAIKHKKFAGTAPFMGPISLIHGIDFNKILSVSAQFLNESEWVNKGDPNAIPGFTCSDTQLIYTFGGGTISNSKPYRLLITYEA